MCVCVFRKTILPLVHPCIYIHPLRRPHIVLLQLSSYWSPFLCLSDTGARYPGDTLRALDFCFFDRFPPTPPTPIKNLKRSRQQICVLFSWWRKKKVGKRINFVRFCLVPRKSRTSRIVVVTGRPLRLAAWRIKKTKKRNGKYVASKERRDLSMITFSLSPYPLSPPLFSFDPFLCTCFAFWIILGGCERLLLPSCGVGRDRKRERKETNRHQIGRIWATVEAHQEALLFLCQGGKWIPTTPLSIRRDR